MHILHCLLPELSPKCIHYPQNAYISIAFDEKYPLIAYIILDLELKYPLIAYIILGLKFKYPLIAYVILGFKKVLDIFKPDNNERKIRDRDQVAVLGRRKEKVCQWRIQARDLGIYP